LGAELVGGVEVGRQPDLDALGLGLLGQAFDDLGAFRIEDAVADRHALEVLEEGVGHAAADDHAVDLVEQVLDQLDLVGDLGPAEDRQERPLGVLERLAEVLELLLHEQARGALGQVDADHRGVGAVGRTERVVDIHVAELGQRGAERLHVFGFRLLALFGRVETQVLEQHDLPGVELGTRRFDLRADAVVQERHLAAEQRLELLGDRRERVLGLGTLALGATEVAHQDHAGATLEGELDRRQSRDDARVVGDLAVGHGHGEVHAHEDSFAGEVEVGDAQLLETHGSSLSSIGLGERVTKRAGRQPPRRRAVYRTLRPGIAAARFYTNVGTTDCVVCAGKSHSVSGRRELRFSGIDTAEGWHSRYTPPRRAMDVDRTLSSHNIAFLEALYEAYEQDPGSVDPEWRAFIEREEARERTGAAPNGTPRVTNGQPRA